MKKMLTAVLGGTAVATLAFASASTLTVNGGTIQAGEDTTLACDSNGVKVEWGLETDTDSVHFITVTGIDEACGGSQIFAKVNGGKTVPGAVAVGATSVKLNLPTPLPKAQDIESVRVWIQG